MTGAGSPASQRPAADGEWSLIETTKPVPSLGTGFFVRILFEGGCATRSSSSSRLFPIPAACSAKPYLFTT